jgi:hypothetical protein
VKDPGPSAGWGARYLPFDSIRAPRGCVAELAAEPDRVRGLRGLVPLAPLDIVDLNLQ